MIEKGSKTTAVLAGTVAMLFAYNAYLAPKGWQKVLFGVIAALELGEATNEWRTS